MAAEYQALGHMVQKFTQGTLPPDGHDKPSPSRTLATVSAKGQAT